jgi:hypothetical protein
LDGARLTTSSSRETTGLPTRLAPTYGQSRAGTGLEASTDLRCLTGRATSWGGARTIRPRGRSGQRPPQGPLLILPNHPSCQPMSRRCRSRSTFQRFGGQRFHSTSGLSNKAAPPPCNRRMRRSDGEPCFLRERFCRADCRLRDQAADLQREPRKDECRGGMGAWNGGSRRAPTTRRFRGRSHQLCRRRGCRRAPDF